MEGFRIGGTNINNMSFAGDTVLLADTEEKLHRLVNDLKEVCW